MQHTFDTDRADRTVDMPGAISKQIGTYLPLQLMLSLATVIIVWLGLSWIGVDFAVTWGALAFIPNVGSIPASIPPILVALVEFPPIRTAPRAGT